MHTQPNHPSDRNLRLWPALLISICLLVQSLAAQTLLYQESFESDGEGTRYKAQNGFDNDSTSYFNRRPKDSVTVQAKGGPVDGDWIWGARGLSTAGQIVGDLQRFESRLWLAPINVSGYRNLELRLVAACGGYQQEYDDALIIEYRIDGTGDWQTLGDGGVWTTPAQESEWVGLGGFHGAHQALGVYFEGDKLNNPLPGAEPAMMQFKEFSWRIWEAGDALELRLYSKSNSTAEAYYFDNVRIYGDNTLGVMTAALNKDAFVETEGAGAGEITLVIDPAAPAGGLPVAVQLVDHAWQHTAVPETILVPAGATTLSVPFDIIDDGRFSGEPLLKMHFSAPGYGRARATYTVQNIHPRPRLLISEFYCSIPSGGGATAYWGDLNGDGEMEANSDEYFELINLDTVPVDISHWIWTNQYGGAKHIFPEGTVLQPGGVIVVFGNGTPTGKFGGAIVQVASTGQLIMGNSADVHSLIANGSIVRQVDWAGSAITPSFEAIVIPDALVWDLGYDIDEGALGDGFGQYVKFSDDVEGLEGPPADGKPKFGSPGTYNDGTPIIQFANEIDLSLPAGLDAMVDSPSGVTKVAGKAIAEGATTTLTITLAEPAPAGGLAVDLRAVAVRSLYDRGRTTHIQMELEANERNQGGEKVIFSENPVIINGASATVEVQILDVDVPDGNIDVRLFAEAPGALLGYIDLTIYCTTFDPAAIVINEALGSVVGSGIDANLNGLPEETVNDQYIELVNTSPGTLNVSGWRLFVFSTLTIYSTGPELVHIFPEGTYLDPDGAILVFGGGDEAFMNSVSAENFGGAQVQVANISPKGINLIDYNNNFIEVYNRHGKIKNRVFYPASLAGQLQSLTRSPDLTGPWGDTRIQPAGGYVLPALHLDVSTTLHSAGKKLDGTAFAGNGPALTPVIAAYRNADLLDWAGYTFSQTYGILYTKEWPWSWHYDLNRWLLPVGGGSLGEGDAQGSLFLFDAVAGDWLYTRETGDAENPAYPGFFDYTTGLWGAFE
jgi:hypothetical protein